MPGPHPRRVLRPREVITVLHAPQPALLALRLACLPARRLPAVPLPTPIARVRQEKPLATQALASAVGMHRPTASPAALDPTNPALINSGGEEHPAQPRRRPFFSESGRKSHQRTTDFTPAILHGFHSAAGTRPLCAVYRTRSDGDRRGFQREPHVRPGASPIPVPQRQQQV